MGSEVRYEIGQNAYIKLVLHVLKHKTSAVNGVLLGRVSGDLVQITDFVPLRSASPPPFEIALIMVCPLKREDYYGPQGFSIAGYFHANERFDDLELGTVAWNIVDHIYKFLPQAALLLLDNKKLGALRNGKDMSPVMELYTRDASENWKLDGSSRLTIKEPSANVVLSDFTSSMKWKDIVDFDDHLDDMTSASKGH